MCDGGYMQPQSLNSPYLSLCRKGLRIPKVGLAMVGMGVWGSCCITHCKAL